MYPLNLVINPHSVSWPTTILQMAFEKVRIYMYRKATFLCASFIYANYANQVPVT